MSIQNNDYIKESLSKEILIYIHGRGLSAPGVFGFLCGATVMAAFAFGGPPGLAFGLVLGGISCGVGIYLSV